MSSSVGAWQTWPMNRDTLSDHGYRLPPEIISHAVWLSHRVGVSVRAVDDLLAQRGLTVSYAATRLWCLTVGSVDARRLTRRQGRLGDSSGPWTRTSPSRASGALSGVPSITRVTSSISSSRRVATARLPNTFCKLLQGQERQPGRLVTDTLPSDRTAHRAVLPSVAHSTDRYAHHRADVSHQPTRHRARHLRRVNSPGQAQRFLTVHGLVRTLVRGGRHLVRAVHHRERRSRSFLIGDAVTLAA